MKPLSPAELDVVSRHDLLTFAHRGFLSLNLGPKLILNWHHEVIAAKLEDVLAGRVRRLIINVPPRHLKSLFASIALPAFCLGRRPAHQILCVSYAQDLANKFARDCRTVMQSAWYQDVFETRLSSRRQAVEEFETTKGGVRLATSVGGMLTGRGADLIIIDDPQKPDEVLSEAQRRTTNDWFDNTLYSRLNDKRAGGIVIIMQRLHEGDLVGHVLEQGGWDILRLPAIAVANESFKFNTYMGPNCLGRKAGCSLDTREPLHVLERTKRIIGEWNFACQYQQAPMPASGGMVKREWFRPYRDAEKPLCAQIVQSWDTASKASDFSDFSVCTTWAVVDRRAYLLHVHRARLEYPELKRAVREQQQLHRASLVLIEDKASGIQLIQELRSEGVYFVQPYHSELSKIERMHAQTAMIEGGFVFVPESVPWLDAYLHELAVFPRGKHDDQVDSTSQFLEWLKQRTMFSQQVLVGRQSRGAR